MRQQATQPDHSQRWLPALCVPTALSSASAAGKTVGQQQEQRRKEARNVTAINDFAVKYAIDPSSCIRRDCKEAGCFLVNGITL